MHETPGFYLPQQFPLLDASVSRQPVVPPHCWTLQLQAVERVESVQLATAHSIGYLPHRCLGELLPVVLPAPFAAHPTGGVRTPTLQQLHLLWQWLPFEQQSQLDKPRMLHGQPSHWPEHTLGGIRPHMGMICYHELQLYAPVAVSGPLPSYPEPAAVHR